MLPGFKKISKLYLDDQGLLSRDMLVPTYYQNVVYAFVRGSKILYIGKANDLWKRFDTYRNCVNWRNARQSNVDKNKKMVETINKGNLWLYVFRSSSMMLDMDEQRLIREYRPVWNIHFNGD
ncbi:endonuclease II [Aeromonas phage Asswx_1]|uniref:Endonuclease II n=1 Tax=Aeromonas phage Asswx_1 TaxID=2419739 RepID=A0A411B8V3_9CAUD|nr:endonuclease II [Aeromonas phage Asswx_1]